MARGTPSLRAKRSNPYRRVQKGGLLRRFAPRNDGGGLATLARNASACRRPSLAAVDLTAHERDGALIDLRGIPRLDCREVGLSRLVSRARAPAVRLQKIRGRVQRIGRDLEIAGAIGQNVFRQKLCLADFA